MYTSYQNITPSYHCRSVGGGNSNNTFTQQTASPGTMMTSSNGIMFCVTGHLCGEFTVGHLCILRTNALMFSFICVWINGWVNNREAGDLRRHRTRYDVIVMVLQAILTYHRADSRFAPSQWETALLCNDVSHWLGANLESVLYHDDVKTCLLCLHYWHFVKGFNFSQVDSLYKGSVLCSFGVFFIVSVNTLVQQTAESLETHWCSHDVTKMYYDSKTPSVWPNTKHDH